MLSTFVRARPIATLIAIFCSWKFLLLLIALTAPGRGYDTSTTLLGSTDHAIIEKLVRWDAIYFKRIAHRGYVFEQEWAFGWGFTRLMSRLAERNGLY